MSGDRDIVDEIDALVDWQMSQEPSGYDHNVNQAECPHPWCPEPWHSLPIKQRMREIRRLWHSTVAYYEDQPRVPEHVTAELDAYRYDQDDSAIICPGSAFEGEFEPPAPTPIAWDAALDPILRAQRMLGEMQDLVIRISGVPPVWDIPDDPLVDQEPGQGLWCDRDRDAAFIVHAAPASDDSWVEVFTRGCPGPGWRRIDPDRPACDGRHVHWAAELPEGPAELSFPNPPRFVSSGEVMIAPPGTDPTDLSQFQSTGFIDETEAPGFDDGRRFSPRPWVRDRTFDRRGRRR